LKKLLAFVLLVGFGVFGYQLPAVGDEAGNVHEGERVVYNQLIV
jgi:hypothetical protein